MTFELHTYDCQDIVLALICNDSSVLKDKPEGVQRLIDLFSEINKMCKPDNGFTVKVEVKA